LQVKVQARVARDLTFDLCPLTYGPFGRGRLTVAV
jgi:hypothetical protein